jgi:hypothetical protein
MKTPTMPPSIPPLLPPTIDPTPIFELFRGNLASELLTASVAHLSVFSHLADGPLPFETLRLKLGLAERPANVLLTFLRAANLVSADGLNRLSLTPLAREHLIPASPLDVSDYIRLAADSPGVKAIVDSLRANRPSKARPDQSGAAYIYREGIESAMELESSARFLTLALAGRAKNVAPCLAERLPLSNARLLLDFGGGTGIYSIALLRQNPNLRAIVWDRPEVLKVTLEFATTYGVTDRLECRPGDMFLDPLPSGADVILMSNVLHDWDVPECRQLIKRCAAALPSNGQLLIHDAFLNDALDGPLPVALYSATLFILTEGRAYSAAEYRTWLAEAGLRPGEITPTLIHCGVLPSLKP